MSKSLCQLSGFSSHSSSKKLNNAISYQKILHTTLSAAHDIQSPLAVIQMIFSSIKNQIPCEEANMIKEAITMIRNTIHQLLDYRIPEPTLTKENYFCTKKNENINLSLLIANIIAHKKCEWLVNSCNIQLIINDDAKEFLISANQNILQRILSNLLNNAYEALNHQKKISIHLYRHENNLILSIKDSGCGIPKNKIDKVLSGTSLKHPGIGLGLLGAVNYMKTINGSLSLSSTPGKGTEVTLVFFDFLFPSS